MMISLSHCVRLGCGDQELVFYGVAPCKDSDSAVLRHTLVSPFGSQSLEPGCSHCCVWSDFVWCPVADVCVWGLKPGVSNLVVWCVCNQGSQTWLQSGSQTWGLKGSQTWLQSQPMFDSRTSTVSLSPKKECFIKKGVSLGRFLEALGLGFRIWGLGFLGSHGPGVLGVWTR